MEGGGGGGDARPAPAEFSRRTAEEELLTHTASSRPELVTDATDDSVITGASDREKQRERERGRDRCGPDQEVTTTTNHNSRGKPLLEQVCAKSRKQSADLRAAAKLRPCSTAPPAGHLIPLQEV